MIDNYEELLKRIADLEYQLKLLKSLEIHEKATLFDSLFNESYPVMLIIDYETGKIVNANKSACKFYGYSLDEIKKLSITQINILPPEEIKKEMYSAKEGNRNYFNFKHKLANGEIRDVEVYSGKVEIYNKIYLFSIIHDIYYRKILERQLHEEYKKNRLILEGLPNPVWLINKDHIIIYQNKNAKQNFNTKIGNYCWYELFQGKYITEDKLKHCLETGEVLPHTHCIFCKADLALNNKTTINAVQQIDDKYFEIWWVFLGDDKYLHYTVDLTKHKQNEINLLNTLKKIEKSESKFKELFENSADAILLLKENKIIDANKSAIKMFNFFSKEEIIGKNPGQLSPTLQPNGNNSIDEANDLIAKTLEQGSSRFEWLHKKSSGEEFFTEIYLTKIPNIEDDFIIHAIIRDISDKKIAETKLKEALMKAEQNDKLKSAFLNNISHEVRTPLNAIQGFSYLLSDPSLSIEKRNYFISIIQTNIDILLKIFSNILTTSLLEANSLKIIKEKFSLNTLIKEIYSKYKTLAESKNINFVFNEVDDSFATIEINTDKNILSEILQNLIDNAIKFTNKGYIEFGFKIKEDFIEFYIKDTGIGIDMSLSNKLFDRFSKTEFYYAGKFSGVGLGLSNSKCLAELLGGELTFKSTTGEGTTFYLNIPKS